MVKKFIEKENGRIVTLLNVDEAKKILEMYINYCLGKREVKIGRLNLVNYLGDFVKYASNKDRAKFYEVLTKEKESFVFSKSDLKAYESLLAFFEIYNGIEKGEFDIINVSNYIMDAINKKKLIDQKVSNNEDLDFEEKLNQIFFNKDFDLSILAQDTCKKWEELLNKKISESPDGIDISLKDEIAYQDLLAFGDGEEFQNEVKTKKNISAQEGKKVENVVEEEKNEIKTTPVTEVKKEEIKVSVPVEETKTPIKETKVETKKEEVKEVAKGEIKEEKNENESKTEESFGPIILNAINDKEEKDKQDKKRDNEQDEIIIGSSSIREATQDVSLRDAAGFFNDAIDDISKNNQNSNFDTSSNNSNNSDNSGFFSDDYGTLRDQ